MTLHPMETRIQQLLLQEKLDEAQKSLEQYKRIEPADKTGISCLEAWLMRKKGDVDGAIDLLTKAIDDGESEFCRCQMSRFALYLKKGDLRSALNDCDTILKEEAPHIKGSFHTYYRFMKAYLLAQFKDREFEQEVLLISEDYSVWISGTDWKSSDLKRLYGR